MKTTKRICIYPKDIQLITGKSYRQSLRILNQMKIHFNKPENGFITIEEFSIYTGINIDSINLQLK